MEARCRPSSTAASTQIVYTDGACSKNGRRGAIAGCCGRCMFHRLVIHLPLFFTRICRYGVFFGAGDPRNVSAALQGPVQTNNRAEMTAVLEALKVIFNSSFVVIHLLPLLLLLGLGHFKSCCCLNVTLCMCVCLHLQICCQCVGLKHICVKSDSQYTVALAFCFICLTFACCVGTCLSMVFTRENQENRHHAAFHILAYIYSWRMNSDQRDRKMDEKLEKTQLDDSDRKPCQEPGRSCSFVRD